MFQQHGGSNPTGANNAAAPPGGGFSFGSAGGSSTGNAPAAGTFSFGASTTNPSASTNGNSGFATSGMGSAPTPGAFSFGSSNTESNPPSAASAPGDFNFGTGSAATTQGTSSTGFSFGNDSGTSSAPALSFGSNPPAASASSLNSSGKDPAVASASFSFSTPSTSSKFGEKPAAAPAGLGGGFSFGTSGAVDSKTSNNPSAALVSDDKQPASQAGSFGGGFSFGASVPDSSNAAPSATNPKSGVSGATTAGSLGGGFSFAGNGAADSKDSGTAAQPNFGDQQPVPVGTPAGAGFSFGASSGAADASEVAKPPSGSSFSFASGTSSTFASSNPDGAPGTTEFSLGKDTSANTAHAPGGSLGTAEADGGGFLFNSKTQEESKTSTDAPTAGPTGNGGAPTFNAATAISYATQPGSSQQLVPTAPSTPATPAPVATPITTTAGATQPEKQPVRLDYQTLTVEQIMNKFQKELEKDALLYNEEARRVAEYDAILRDSQRDIATLTEQTHRAMLQQQEVEQTLQGIGTLQDELDRTVEGLQSHLDELFDATKNLAPVEADRQREQAYSTARAVDRRLQSLHDSLHLTMEELNAAQERSLPKEGDLRSIFKILNQHQDLLSDLDASSRQMEKDIEQASRLLTQG